MKRIVFTGGGTAGHVTPNLALIPYFAENGWDIHYIGTRDGIEHTLIDQVPGVCYHTVHSGKLRRYFSLENFTDPFKMLYGVGESAVLMRKLRPDVVFSKGGFVSVPVVLAASMFRVPAVLHESDITPGLANRLTIPFSKVICTTFPEAAAHIGEKAVYTGTPMRKALFDGSRERGLMSAGFAGDKPVLLMMGGSSGAASVNQALRDALPALLAHFDVLHICGRGNLEPSVEGTPGYHQVEYMDDALPDAYAAADLMLSRAGANALSEILALRKPVLLVPYPIGASRGDQVQNAESFRTQGLAHVLPQDQMTAETLTSALFSVWEARDVLQEAMMRTPAIDGTNKVIDIILKAARC